MGSIYRAPGGRDAVAFVETVLPSGCDGIAVGGLEYVARVEHVDDLPAWADAVRIRDVAYLPKTPVE